MARNRIALVAQRLVTIALVSIAIVYLSFLAMAIIESRDAQPENLQLGELAAGAAKATVNYFRALFQGDLGTVTMTSGERAVGEVVWFAFRNSMALILIAVGGAAIIGLLLGTYAGLRPLKRREYTVLTLTLIGISAPAFLIAILLQAAGIKYTVTYGRQLVRMGGYGWDFKHLAMPLLVLAFRPLAYITRSTFVGIRRIMREDYIRTAFSKGLRLSDTLLGHAYKNLGVPYLTAIAVSLRFSLSILPIVEFVFGWPGMGLGLLQAINNRQPILVVTYALMIGLTFQFVNLALDISYRLVDPRLRLPVEAR
ncbi:MAG: ABC transporter permease [Chloroflexota bacterium]|nr:MAG: ABC transporter permease [Chloroflexota bacterium]